MEESKEEPDLIVKGLALLSAVAEGSELSRDDEYALGLMYEQGEGVVQDYKQARHWFEKAANRGDKYAQHALAVMYRLGKGVEQSNEQAAYWYRISDIGRNDGCVQGDVMMGGMYIQNKVHFELD